MTVTASYSSSESRPRTYSPLTPTCSTVTTSPFTSIGKTLSMKPATSVLVPASLPAPGRPGSTRRSASGWRPLANCTSEVGSTISRYSMSALEARILSRKGSTPTSSVGGMPRSFTTNSS